jgi:hypothetical protein
LSTGKDDDLLHGRIRNLLRIGLFNQHSKLFRLIGHGSVSAFPRNILAQHRKLKRILA